LLLDRLEVTTSLHRALYVRINMDLGTPGREWEHSNYEAAAENDASDKAFAISSQSDLVHSSDKPSVAICKWHNHAPAGSVRTTRHRLSGHLARLGR
jgi:hypothetical protein